MAGLGVPRDVVDLCHDNNVLIASMCGKVRHAVAAVEAGCDLVIAQGTEAGGHTGTVATMALVPQVVDVVDGRVPVVAAGGLFDGRGLAAALTLGAAGVWVGTRFIATPEAWGTPGYKDRLLGMAEDDTVITRAYTGKTCRVNRNAYTRAFDEAGGPAEPFPAQFVQLDERRCQPPGPRTRHRGRPRPSSSGRPDRAWGPSTRSNRRATSSGASWPRPKPSSTGWRRCAEPERPTPGDRRGQAVHSLTCSMMASGSLPTGMMFNTVTPASANAARRSLHEPLGAAEVGELEELRRDLGRRLVLLAVEVEVLDLGGLGLVAVAAHQVVVEVATLRPHAADVEGHHGAGHLARPARASSPMATTPPAAISRGPSVGVALLGTGGEVGAPHLVRPFGHEEDRQPTVGLLGGHGHVLGTQRGHPDRDPVTDRAGDDLERLAEARALIRRQRELVVATVVGDALAAPHRAADVDHLAGAPERCVVPDAVEALDHLGAGRPEAEDEPTVGERVDPRRGHRHERRGAGVDRQDAGADGDRLGAWRRGSP